MKDYMESALEMARQLHESLGDIEEWGIDNGDEMQQVLQDLQIACMVGPYGVTSPPLRAQCLPTLHQPGHNCPREVCVEEGLDCPANTYEVGFPCK